MPSEGTDMTALLRIGRARVLAVALITVLIAVAAAAVPGAAPPAHANILGQPYDCDFALGGVCIPGGCAGVGSQVEPGFFAGCYWIAETSQGVVRAESVTQSIAYMDLEVWDVTTLLSETRVCQQNQAGSLLITTSCTFTEVPGHAYEAYVYPGYPPQDVVSTLVAVG
jgi:hypothetical protein